MSLQSLLVHFMCSCLIKYLFLKKNKRTDPKLLNSCEHTKDIKEKVGSEIFPGYHV